MQCRPIGSVRLQDPTACLWVGFPAKFIIREEVRLLPLSLRSISPPHSAVPFVLGAAAPRRCGRCYTGM